MAETITDTVARIFSSVHEEDLAMFKRFIRSLHTDPFGIQIVAEGAGIAAADLFEKVHGFKYSSVEANNGTTATISQWMSLHVKERKDNFEVVYAAPTRLQLKTDPALSAPFIVVGLADGRMPTVRFGPLRGPASRSSVFLDEEFTGRYETWKPSSNQALVDAIRAWAA